MNNIKFCKYRAECTEAGLYSRNEYESFVLGEYGDSRIGPSGTDMVKVFTLDEFMKDKKEKITYIKMDIEGSELEALKGAAGIIEADHPKLAISVYHELSHLLEILLWIHSIFPAYKFFLRHYMMTDCEKVLYARWEEEK